jgi:aminoglycoside 2''-phosphotransferase
MEMLREGEALALLAEGAPELEVRTARPTQQGWDSLTLLVNEEWIFRFARRPDVAARLTREVRLLPRLAEALPVAIPRFEYVADDHAGGVRCVGYRAIVGERLTRAALTPERAANVIEQLGAFLTALHGFPVAEATALGVLGGDVAGWHGELAERYAEVREHVLPLLSADERRASCALWEGFLAAPESFAFQPALIHRDLGAEHLLFQPETGRLAGVIDWGDAWIGDPALDFVGITRELGRELAERVLTSYGRPIEPSGAAFWARVRFFGALEPFYEIIFGRLEGDEEHIARGLAHLRRELPEW